MPSRQKNNAGRGRGKRSKSVPRKGKGNHKEDFKKKTLSDHVCQAGSAKNASDCVASANFILNHIELTFAEGLDIATAMKTRKEFDFDADRPKLKISANTDATIAAVENEQYKLEFKVQFEKFDERENQYRRNKNAAAALLWKQCSSGVRSKLQARTDFEKIEKDPIALLKAIKEHSMNYKSSQCKMRVVTDAVRSFVNTKQKHGESLNDYLERFKATKGVLFSHVGKHFEKLLMEHKDCKSILLQQNTSI